MKMRYPYVAVYLHLNMCKCYNTSIQQVDCSWYIHCTVNFDVSTMHCSIKMGPYGYCTINTYNNIIMTFIHNTWVFN
jgi:hypothetical protein